MRQAVNLDKVIIESLAARVVELSGLLEEEIVEKDHFREEARRYEKLLDTDQNTLQDLLTSLRQSARPTEDDSYELKWWKDEIRDILECYYPTKGVE